MAEPNRRGRLLGTGTLIDRNVVEFIHRSPVAISVRSESETGEWPLCKLLRLTIDVDFRDMDLNGEDYVIRALPAIHISDDELGVENDDMIKCHGLLQAIHPLTASRIEHSFALFAISPCLIRLIVHVERLSDHRVFPHPAPLEIDFKE